jgi:hypothetical protein
MLGLSSACPAEIIGRKHNNPPVNMKGFLKIRLFRFIETVLMILLHKYSYLISICSGMQ